MTKHPRVRASARAFWTPALLLASLAVLSGAALAQPIAVLTHASGDANRISIVDTSTDTFIESFTVCRFGGACPTYAVALAPDGSRAYAATDLIRGGVTAIDLTTGATSTVIAGSSPSALAVSSDGSRLYVAFRDSSEVVVIDTLDHSVVARIPVATGPEAFALHPDGTRLYVAGFAPTVTVIDVVTNSVVGSITVGSSSHGLAVHPSGTRLYVALQAAQLVAVVDTESESVVTTVRVGHRHQGPSALAVHPSGTLLYGIISDGGRPGFIFAIDTATDAIVFSGIGSVGAGPLSVNVHPDGSRIYVTTELRGHLEIYSTETGRRIESIPLGDHPAAWGQFLSGTNRPPCGAGTVNHRIPEAGDVVRVNGGHGDANRFVRVAVGAPVTLSLASSPAGSGAGRYALWVWRGAPANVTPLVVGGELIGCTVNPNPTRPLEVPQPTRCLLGVNAMACAAIHTLANAPRRAPWTIVRAAGLRRPGEFTLQGVLEDRGADNAAGFSVTNAIVLRVE